MCYPDIPLHPESSETFLRSHEVLAYFQTFADHFKLRPHIYFNHKVLLVRPLANDVTTKICADLNWEITVQHLVAGANGEPAGRIETFIFDAVFVTIGQNHTPNVPVYPDIDLYRGNVHHCKTYRTTKPFVGHSVLIIGAGPSGLDLALLLAPHAQRVALSVRKALPPELAAEYAMRTEVMRFTKDGVIFADGLEETYTDVILCTGYKHSYPFLSVDCGIRLDEDGYVVRPLFKECINIERPSMFLVGITYFNTGIQVMDMQVRFCLAFLAGDKTLPSRNEMLATTADDMRARLVEYKGNAKYSHKLGVFQEAYLKELAELGGLKPIKPVVIRIFNESVRYFYNNGLQRYRRQRFRMLNDEEFEMTLVGDEAETLGARLENVSL